MHKFTFEDEFLNPLSHEYVKRFVYANRDLAGADFYHTDMDEANYPDVLIERLKSDTLEFHDRLFLDFIAGFRKRITPKLGESLENFIEMLNEYGLDDEVDRLLNNTVIPYSNDGARTFWKNFFKTFDVKPFTVCDLLGIDKDYVARVMKGRARISKPVCFALCMFFELNESNARGLLAANDIALCEHYGPDVIFLNMIRNKRYEFSKMAELIYSFGEMVNDTLAANNSKYFKDTQKFYSHYDEYTDATYSGCKDETGKFNAKYGRKKYQTTRYVFEE